MGAGFRPSPRGPPVEEEAVGEGRRARKSVNYALPKLNTCVLPPCTSAPADPGSDRSKMRRPQEYVATISSTATTKPRKSFKPTSSAPSSSAPLSASGASRKPRSTTPTPASLSMPLSTPGGGSESEGEESFPFEARKAARAGRDVEESRANAGTVAGARRRSMGVI